MSDKYKSIKTQTLSDKVKKATNLDSKAMKDAFSQKLKNETTLSGGSRITDAKAISKAMGNIKTLSEDKPNLMKADLSKINSILGKKNYPNEPTTTGKRALNINVEPYAMITVLSCQLDHIVNDHSKATVSGIIDESLVDEYLDKAHSETAVKIMVETDTNETICLFYGTLKKMDVKVVNQYHVASLDLISFTEDMDIVEHTRTYQRPSLLYGDILNSLNYYEGYSHIMSEGRDTAIENMIVQYCETDWNFIKRLASHFKAFVIPYSKEIGAKYYFGFPVKSNEMKIDTPLYSIEKDISAYDYQGNPIQPGSNDMYIIKNRALMDLCDRIILNGQELFIYEIHSELENGELQNTYKLKRKIGFTQPHISNYHLTGTALLGTVSRVERDEVQVTLYTDRDNSITDNVRWIPYSTIYSTDDGTGWYMMPEVGDEIRLYFPSEKDAEGFVMSSVHLESSNFAARSKPNEKSLRNKYGKEVLLTPDKVVMSNNAGMAITLDDNKGIFIESNKDISINAQDAINMVSANSSISITGSSEVNIRQNNSSIELKDEVFFKGTQVKIQ